MTVAKRFTPSMIGKLVRITQNDKTTLKVVAQEVGVLAGYGIQVPGKLGWQFKHIPSGNLTDTMRYTVEIEVLE